MKLLPSKLAATLSLCLCLQTFNTTSFAGAPSRIVHKVAAMTEDQKVIDLAARRKLDVVNVMWEDTGRWEGSSVGPNISDVTIEVQTEGKHGKETVLMPVIRPPNFSDITGDIDIDKFLVRVGNEAEGRPLQTVSLRELLAEPTRYMSLPNKGKIKRGTLLGKRDKKVLVSAQSAFLPVPKTGNVKFWPVIFNYQSYKKNPAVLTILVTRQGTSMTVVDNMRDTVPGTWGQRLYFNEQGQRAPLLAERLSDVQNTGVTANGESAASLGQDANLLMIIQVPLKQRAMPRKQEMPMASMEAAAADDGAQKSKGKSGYGGEMEVAVLGHGPTEGKFTELDGLTIERDTRFPVRVTVQFYQATETGKVGRLEMAQISKQIRNVYKQADYVGSLVVPQNELDRNRVTAWAGAEHKPGQLSWSDFPGVLQWWSQQSKAPTLAK